MNSVLNFRNMRWCCRSESWSLFCVSRVTHPEWCGRLPVTPGARPSALRIFSTQRGRSPTALLNTPQTCLVWHSTDTRTARFVLQTLNCVCLASTTQTHRCSFIEILKKKRICIFLQGLFSSVTCPGLVMTNLTFGILPSFFWTLIMPIMWMVRVHSLFYMFMCNFPKLLKTFFCFRQTDPNFHQHFYTHPKQWSRGTGVFLSHDLYFYLCSLLFWCLVNAPKIINVHSASLQFWLFLQKPEVLDSRAKYHSLTSGLGTKYTEPRQVSLQR